MPLTMILLAAWCGVLLGWRLAHLQGQILRYLPAVVPLALFAAFMQFAPALSSGQIIQDVVQWVPALQVSFALRLDGFSLLFALLITGIGTLVTVYATAYFSDVSTGQRVRFICLILAFMASMLGTVLSDNLVVMFVFWEATSLLSFLLIGFDADKPEARKAALQSLLVTGAGGLALFGGILLIGMSLSTFSMAEIALRKDEFTSSSWMVPAVILLMVGAFTKSAQFPFHFWLPQAMAAPTPASAYLHSATMVKLGVYLLARFDVVLADVGWYGDTLVVVGMATMLVAAKHAIRATGYKAILAQSTVASLGILVMLIGLDGPVASMAVVAFIVAHAFYKAALFFCAGTVIHLTHISELSKLGGLARLLPFTAAAAVLASLSMAGLPPFVGFIAKEYLFEAQLDSAWNVVPVVVAVLVNSAMVAIAAVVTLRPFFARRKHAGMPLHSETPGLFISPLTLGLAGIFAGVLSARVAQYLITPAASALYGAPVALPFTLWHGLTPMLALSALVVSLGAVLAWKWDALHKRLAHSPLLLRFDANRTYLSVVDGVLSAARWSTHHLQNGDIRHYTLVTCLALLGTTLWSLKNSSLFGVFSYGDSLRLLPAGLLLFGVIGALVAARTSTALLGLIGVGVVGYGSALFFLLHGAPDLALTQFAVETLVLIVLMAIMVHLPDKTLATRKRSEKRVDVVIAAAFGVLVFVALASMLSLPFDSRLSDFFAASSYYEAHGKNVVNVIIVDYRALDTIGEIAVVGFAALGVWVLLRRHKSRRVAQGNRLQEGSS